MTVEEAPYASHDRLARRTVFRESPGQSFLGAAELQRERNLFISHKTELYGKGTPGAF